MKITIKNPAAMRNGAAGQKPSKVWRGVAAIFSIAMMTVQLGCSHHELPSPEDNAPPPTLDAYVSDMRLVQQALEAGDRHRAQQLLARYVPKPGAADLRGFEWRYGWRRAHNSNERDRIGGLVITNTDSPLVFLADNRTLVAGCVEWRTNFVAKLFDVAKLKRIDTITSAREPLLLCNDSNTVITAGYSGLQYWDVRSKEISPLWFFARGGEWRGAAFTADGGMAAARVGTGIFQILDINNRTNLTNIVAHSDPIRGLAFSPDDRTLASAGLDGLVKLWDWKEARCLDTLTNHADGVTCVAFSPDGQRLASGSLDATVMLWDLKSNAPPRRLEGHLGPVWTVAFTLDGKTLASGSADNTIKLWNVALAQEIATLSVREGKLENNSQKEVVRVAFSPDSCTLAARLNDGTLHVWRGAPP